MGKSSISVREMGETLGLSKVESYWLVHQGHFPTILVKNKMRIRVTDFEKWYAGQFHYKKVNGEAPGAHWLESTLSIQDVAAMLGISRSTVYDLLKKGTLQGVPVDHRTRIDKSSFFDWYAGQSHYKMVST